MQPTIENISEGLIMQQIRDYKIYNYRMKKSLLDKMFFLDKFFEHIEIIVDFGCADGELIGEMKHLFPEYRYIGYDISDEMLHIAREKNKDIEFYDNWDNININFNSSLLNISSTIHEVYSYGVENDVKEFWDRVYRSGFKYICIRDMMLSSNLKENVKDKDVSKIKETHSGSVNDFEKIWGTINEKKNLIHYLLKYRYVENWEREVRENYFPITVEELLKNIPSNYRIIYSEHYTLPYIAHQVKTDFGIILDEKTHFKLILKRIEE